jgi:hypothetical protein
MAAGDPFPGYLTSTTTATAAAFTEPTLRSLDAIHLACAATYADAEGSAGSYQAVG